MTVSLQNWQLLSSLSLSADQFGSPQGAPFQAARLATSLAVWMICGLATCDRTEVAAVFPAKTHGPLQGLRLGGQQACGHTNVDGCLLRAGLRAQTGGGRLRLRFPSCSKELGWEEGWFRASVGCSPKPPKPAQKMHNHALKHAKTEPHTSSKSAGYQPFTKPKSTPNVPKTRSHYIRPQQAQHSSETSPLNCHQIKANRLPQSERGR